MEGPILKDEPSSFKTVGSRVKKMFVLDFKISIYCFLKIVYFGLQRSVRIKPRHIEHYFFIVTLQDKNKFTDIDSTVNKIV